MELAALYTASRGKNKTTTCLAVKYSRFGIYEYKVYVTNALVMALEPSQ